MGTHYFIAISLPPFIKEVLASWKEQAQNILPFQTWVHQEDYHITLAFLGSVSLDKLSLLQTELKHLAVPNISLALQGLHTFGSPRQPRVLWAGVTAEPQLYTLQQDVKRICENVGFSLEKRPYKPHITLARRWRGEEPFKGADTQAWDGMEFLVEKVALYETQLNQVPKYKEIYSQFRCSE
ncbi:MAG: RNA 2',3'-cyclic phosphodiesterase [Ectobacillus sp.]